MIQDFLRMRDSAPRADIIAHVQREIGTSVSAVKQALKRLTDDGEITGDNGIYRHNTAA